MLPDRVSNPGPLTYESGALPIALRGPAMTIGIAYPSIYVTDLRSFFCTVNHYFGDHKFEISVVGHGTL